MLTLGTGERVTEGATVRGIQLLPAHCYAVTGESIDYILALHPDHPEKMSFRVPATER